MNGDGFRIVTLGLQFFGAGYIRRMERLCNAMTRSSNATNSKTSTPPHPSGSTPPVWSCLGGRQEDTPHQEVDNAMLWRTQNEQMTESVDGEASSIESTKLAGAKNIR